MVRLVLLAALVGCFCVAGVQGETRRALFQQGRRRDNSDDRTYLEVRGETGECTPATFGGLFPTAGLEAPVQVIRGCGWSDGEDLFERQLKRNGTIVVLDYSTAGDTKGCSVYSDLLHMGSLARRSRPIMPAALVVVSRSNFTGLHEGGRKHSAYPMPPICSINSNTLESVLKVLAGSSSSSPTVSDPVNGIIHNGRSEEFRVLLRNAVLLEMRVDGERVDGGSALGYSELKGVVPDSYRTVALRMKCPAFPGPSSSVQAPPQARFRVSFSDHFVSSASWVCTRSPHADWRTPHYFAEMDSVTSFTKTQLEITDVAYSRWDQRGIWMWAAGTVVAGEGEAGTAMDELTCFGSKHTGTVRKFGYDYFASPPLEGGYAAALEYCRRKRATIVSVHSRWESDLVASLVHPDRTATGIFIGLSDRETLGRFRWEDGLLLDYSNWRVGHPLLSAESQCVAIVGTSLRDPYTGKSRYDYAGKWMSVPCSSPGVTVCRRAVAHTEEDDTTLEAHGNCMAFLDEGHVTPNAPPQLLGRTNHSLCSYGSGGSCCSTAFVNGRVTRDFEEMVGHVESRRCKDAFAKLLCAPCLADQGKFIKYDVQNGLRMHICEDTCGTIYEDCKDDAKVGPMLRMMTAKEMCEQFAKGLSAGSSEPEPTGGGGFGSGGVIDLVASGNDDCLRIDDVAPFVVAYTPAVGGSFPVRHADGVLKIQFQESVRIVAGALEVWPAADADAEAEVDPDEDDEEEEEEVTAGLPTRASWQVDLHDPALVWFESTDYDNDTIVVSSLAAPCLPKGTYHVFVPSMSVLDFAGNAFHGNNRPAHSWTLEFDDANCAAQPGNKSGGGLGAGAVVVVLLVLGSVLGAGVVVSKRGGRGGAGAGAEAGGVSGSGVVGAVGAGVFAALGAVAGVFSSASRQSHFAPGGLSADGGRGGEGGDANYTEMSDRDAGSYNGPMEPLAADADADVDDYDADNHGAGVRDGGEAIEMSSSPFASPNDVERNADPLGNSLLQTT